MQQRMDAISHVLDHRDWKHKSINISQLAAELHKHDGQGASDAGDVVSDSEEEVRGSRVEMVLQAAMIMMAVVWRYEGLLTYQLQCCCVVTRQCCCGWA